MDWRRRRRDNLADQTWNQKIASKRLLHFGLLKEFTQSSPGSVWGDVHMRANGLERRKSREENRTGIKTVREKTARTNSVASAVFITIMTIIITIITTVLKKKKSHFERVSCGRAARREGWGPGSVMCARKARPGRIFYILIRGHITTPHGVYARIKQ